MGFVSKDMGSVVLAAGTLGVTIFYDDTTISSSSHIPDAEDCLVSFGEVIERPEDSPLIFKMGTLNVGFKDDYTNYVSGVLWKILQGSETQFRFYLDEGAGYTFLFWGIVQGNSVKFEELYVYNEGASGRFVRALTFALESMLKKVADLSIANAVSEIQSGGNRQSSGYNYFMTFNRVFGSIFEKAFGASDADALTSAVFPATQDPILYSYGGAWYSIKDIAMLCNKSDITEDSPYLSSANALYWGNVYNNALELVGGLARQFGYLVRHSYGLTNGIISATPADNLHRICLTQREGNGSSLTSIGDLIASEVSIDNDFTVKSVKTVRTQDETQTYAVGNDKPPGIIIPIDFTFTSGTYTPTDYEKLWKLTPTNYEITGVKVWDAVAGAYDTLSLVTRKSLTGVLRYYSKRYYSSEKVKKVCYVRKYKGLKANDGSTNSHLNIYSGQKIAIHNGLNSKGFFAHEVKKDIVNNELTVEWREI
jgi:hypothetical protein